MKQIVMVSIALVMMMSNWSCNAQTTKKEGKSNAPEKVEVYYFHFTGRCFACRNVESQAKANIESLYDGKVSFQSVNLDEASNRALAQRLRVYGQTLLIVKGDIQINITNEGFMYASRQPDRFKAIIKEKVDGLIN